MAWPVGAAIMLAFAGCLLAAPSSAAVIYEEMFTGAGLLHDDRVVFGRTPTESGTSLVFGPGAYENNLLFRLPVVEAGVAESSQPITFTISYQFTRITDDTDLSAGINDAHTNYQLFMLIDNRFEPKLWAVDLFTLFNPHRRVATRLITGPGGSGFPAIGASAVVSTMFTIDQGVTDLVANALGSTGTHSFASQLDLTDPLRVAFVASGPNEEYQIDWLSVTVEASVVPEPPTAALLAVGVLGLAAAGWRRTAV